MDDTGARGGVGQAPAPGDVDRFEALEQQVRQLTSRLAGWVEAQLVQAADDRRNDIKALRAELQIIVNEQLAGMRAERAADAAATATALSGAPSVDPERLDALEQRVRSAMSRLSESVETRLTEVDKARQSELDALRRQLQAVDERVGEPASAAGLSALSAEVEAGPARIDAFEQRVKAAMVRLTDSVETRLAEAATTRSSDLEGLRSELTKRIDELQRTGSTVSGRVEAVSQRALAVADDIGALRVEVKGGTARNDELEKRVKAAIARLAESVESRLAEFAVQSTDENATRLAAAAEQRRAELESLQVAFEEQAAKAEASLDTVNASVQATLRESDVRLRQMIQAKQGDFEAIAGGVAKARTEMATAVASVNRKLAATEEQVQKRLATLSDKVDALTKTAAVEAGSLAPLRSDLRLLQGQVAELADVIADLRPKRKPAAKKAAAAPAKKAAAAPAKKATAKKAPRRKAQ